MKKFLMLFILSVSFLLCGEELIAGKFRMVMRKNGTAPQEIWYDNCQLTRSLFYSWYVRGDWFSDRSKVTDIKVISQSKNQLKVEYSCIDFKIQSEYTFLTDPDALKVEFYFPPSTQRRNALKTGPAKGVRELHQLLGHCSMHYSGVLKEELTVKALTNQKGLANTPTSADGDQLRLCC